MKAGVLRIIFWSFFTVFGALGTARAEMDRWEALAMRDRYAEKHPETLNRPAPEASVQRITVTKPKDSASPTPRASVKSLQTNSAPKLPKTEVVVKPSEWALPIPAVAIAESGRLAPTIKNLRMAAHQLAEKKLSYVFGADEVDSGGLDCSSTVQYLLSERLGIKGVPRTSYLQYEWLAKKGTLNKLSGKRASDKLLRKLSSGDLIFWGKTWSSGHKVSHVMIYMGWNPSTKQHFVFGARGKKVKGLTGAGVDVFELNPDRGVLVGHGSVPGLR